MKNEDDSTSLSPSSSELSSDDEQDKQEVVKKKKTQVKSKKVKLVTVPIPTKKSRLTEKQKSIKPIIKAIMKIENQASNEKVINTRSKARKESVIASLSVEDKIPTFAAHIPRWGGYFIKKNDAKITVINTCTIDNYLFALWVLSKLMSNFHQLNAFLEHTDALNEIILNIEMFNWNNARQIWYTKVMKLNYRNKKKLCFFGTVEDMFLKYMYSYQTHDLIQNCSIDCIYNGNTLISEKSDLLQFGKTDNGVKVVTETTNQCLMCLNRVTCDIRFRNNPLFVFIETNSHLTINELPKVCELDSKSFKLLCAIFYIENIKHFVSVFEIDNNNYLVDDMKIGALLLSPQLNLGKNDIDYYSLFVSSALYYLA